MKKYEKNRNKQELKQLTPIHLKMFTLLMEGFHALKDSFNEIIKT